MSPQGPMTINQSEEMMMSYRSEETTVTGQAEDNRETLPLQDTTRVFVSFLRLITVQDQIENK